MIKERREKRLRDVRERKKERREEIERKRGK